MPPPPHSQIVVVISADMEWRLLSAIIPGADRHVSPLGEWFLHKVAVGARPVTLTFFHGGWGKISAAATAQYVIDRCRPALIVNLGTCGGFDGEVETGTILLVDRTVVYDIVEQMGDHAEHLAHYTTELALDWLAEPYPHEVLRTHLVSGDRDLLAEDIPRLKRDYRAVAGDWESGSIAWVARRNNVPCLILRGVSDLVGTGGGEAYEDIAVFERGARAVLERLVHQLPDWLAACRVLDLDRQGRLDAP